MIKKIITFLVAGLLCFLNVYVIMNGLIIGNFISIPSYNSVPQNITLYNEKITQYEQLVNVEFENKITALEKSKTEFETVKASYLDTKNLNSYEDLIQLTRDKQYPIEFLWIKLELIARNNGLAYNFNIVDSNNSDLKDIKVILQGDYLAIKNFIYDMLIDLELQFQADNLKIVPVGTEVNATFNITGLDIVM